MRKLVFVPGLLLCLFTAPLHAQVVTKRAFDPFTSRAYLDWSVPGSASAIVSGDAFRFENKNGNMSSSWQNLDMRGGCSVAVTTRHASGVIDYPYGLSFYGKDYDNEFFFLISADGSYRVGKFDGGEWHDIVEWTESDAINTGMNAENFLLADCRDTWRFFINATLVESMPAQERFGGNAGIAVEELQTIAFDDFFAGEYTTRAGDQDFQHKFGALVDDFKNEFANSLGDTIPMTMGGVHFADQWEVKDPIPDMKEQHFMRSERGIEYFGTVAAYSSYRECVDAYERLHDHIDIATTECVLIDMGEETENNIIQSTIWSAVDTLVENQKSPYYGMYISEMIDPPSDDHKEWVLHVLVIGKKK